MNNIPVHIFPVELRLLFAKSGIIETFRVHQTSNGWAFAVTMKGTGYTYVGNFIPVTDFVVVAPREFPTADEVIKLWGKNG